MIVGFYPGSGGHRYKLFLQNQFFGKRGAHMHNDSMPIRYALDTCITTQLFDVNTIQITHTLNTANIKRLWPGHEIRKIKFDLKPSLCREWEVEMKYHWQPCSQQQQVSHMFDMIVWHQDYYKTQDWDCDVLIDIATDTTPFGDIMRKELDIKNFWFDFAWDCYENYGAEAPIDDLYKQQLLTI
tara:strand:- start:390 stop:941 length:552 start_codon:yes stop_codon:yes gene_type:complete